jgi:low temperature requirement protein LtrA
MARRHSPIAVPAMPAARVSTLELFFDLVFVFTITQLTAVLANDITVVVTLRVLLMLAIILWMYGGYAWLTNAISPNTRFRRTFYLVGMGGFLGISLSIPDAFGSTGWLFGLGYFVVNGVHTGLIMAAAGPNARRAMSRLGTFNLVTATLVLVGGFLPVGWRSGLWAAALVLLIISPYVNPIGGFTISPTHFVERHGLLIIIALGESIVAIGAGAAGQEITLGLVAVAVLGLSVSYMLWWIYFAGDDTQAEHALEAIDPARRARAAVEAYGWAHYLLLLGIVGTAAGVKKAVAHPVGHLTWAQALVLGGGVAAYLLGDVWFRRVLRIGRLRYRLLTAAAVLVTVPVGAAWAPGQLIALIAIIVAMFYTEEWDLRRGLSGQEVEQPAT